MCLELTNRISLISCVTIMPWDKCKWIMKSERIGEKIHTVFKYVNSAVLNTCKNYKVFGDLFSKPENSCAEKSKVISYLH